jgi:hypothetical protein
MSLCVVRGGWLRGKTEGSRADSSCVTLDKLLTFLGYSVSIPIKGDHGIHLATAFSGFPYVIFIQRQNAFPYYSPPPSSPPDSPTISERIKFKKGIDGHKRTRKV